GGGRSTPWRRGSPGNRRGSSPSVPGTTSSWSFESSRHTAAGRSGASAASAVSESGRRRGDSNATTVSGEPRTRSSSPPRRGSQPSKRHLSAGSPEETTAAVTADGPGSTPISSSRSMHARVRRGPGADHPGGSSGERRGGGRMGGRRPERDHGLGRAEDALELTAAPRQPALKAPLVGGQPRGDDRGGDGGRAREHLDLEIAVDARADQAVARIGHPGR